MENTVVLHLGEEHGHLHDAPDTDGSRQGRFRVAGVRGEQRGDCAADKGKEDQVRKCHLCKFYKLEWRLLLRKPEHFQDIESEIAIANNLCVRLQTAQQRRAVNRYWV